MFTGDKINTSLGEAIILSNQEAKDYLILFVPEEAKFIKANGVSVHMGQAFWSQGEYYNSFEDLITNIK